MFRRDVVLTVSLVLAVLSCLIAPPSPAYVGYIDFNTLIVLFCLMLLVEGLREENFLQYIAAKVLSRVGTMRGMAATLIFLCFFSSMFITNDVSLITFVPLGVMMLRMASLRRKLCYTVTLMTIAANLGSMFTPIGNPQNLYLFSPDPTPRGRRCCWGCACSLATATAGCPSAWGRPPLCAGETSPFIWSSFCCACSR